MQIPPVIGISNEVPLRRAPHSILLPPPMPCPSRNRDIVREHESPTASDTNSQTDKTHSTTLAYTNHQGKEETKETRRPRCLSRCSIYLLRAYREHSTTSSKVILQFVLPTRDASYKSKNHFLRTAKINRSCHV